MISVIWAGHSALLKKMRFSAVFINLSSFSLIILSSYKTLYMSTLIFIFFHFFFDAVVKAPYIGGAYIRAFFILFLVLTIMLFYRTIRYERRS